MPRLSLSIVVRHARPLAGLLLAALASTLPAQAAWPRAPQRDLPRVEGVYVGSGTLDEPCVYPSGPVTFMDTITSMSASITQKGDQLTLVAPYTAQRPDGSTFTNIFNGFRLTLAANRTVNGVADYMFDPTTQVHLVISGAFVDDRLDLTFASHIVLLPDNGFCDQTIAVSLRYDRLSATAELAWLVPSGSGLAPPRNLRARFITLGGGSAALAAESPRATLQAYNVYRSQSPNVQTTPENLFTSVPATQTTATATVAPGGSFFVVTGVYDTGESGASNETQVGQAGATLTKVTLKTTKIVAKGTGFTATVKVFVDGIPFVAPAVVKNGTKVTQKGLLITGQTLAEYTAPGVPVTISFANDDGGLSQKSTAR